MIPLVGTRGRASIATIEREAFSTAAANCSDKLAKELFVSISKLHFIFLRQKRLCLKIVRKEMPAHQAFG
jgi:hypothetical protein